MTIVYRATANSEPWVGFGSFWTDSPELAKKYGSGNNFFQTEAEGKVLEVKDDFDLENKLLDLGVTSPEEIIDEPDWYKDFEVKKALKQNNIEWISKPIEPSISLKEKEWIYIGDKKLKYEKVFFF